MNKEIVIVEGARTPFAKISGLFKDIKATDLGVIAAKEAIRRSGIDASEIDEVIFGNVQQSSQEAHMLARHVALKAGAKENTPGLTVNRVCGTGIEVLIQAAKSIQLGDAEVVLAGGTENMSQVPHVIRGMRWGTPLGSPEIQDWLWDGLLDTNVGCTMAVTAENLAKQYQLTREEIDAHAYSSHERARANRDKLREEIVPVEVKTKKGTILLEEDQHVRETSMEQLAKLPARFIEGGVVTPGNASGMVDGAAAVIVTTSDYAKKHQLRPLAKLVSYEVVGVDPTIMGIGPVPAIQGALKKANLTIDDLDLVEINEAFSAQYLACQKELGFDLDKANVNGGAIAIGHPLATSGTRITYSMILELHRRKARYAVSSACIGGGQGIASIWEAIYD
ncbi:acetyl-CoA C-acetyltransferase [Savagea sp. SN6]|uniref:acetyl-CoA C-acetyltransferase n=1 Tax=Savagea serpentis TaxID=2785297 RepID=A0A8J7GCW9_9BACL|nr:acetyl-CoA C-acetyltransferase [Savagea serpentis]MBF4501870.1 acetyl-CoA C-acetyltransferase [Savagea serpentis]